MYFQISAFVLIYTINDSTTENKTPLKSRTSQHGSAARDSVGADSEAGARGHGNRRRSSWARSEGGARVFPRHIHHSPLQRHRQHPHQRGLARSRPPPPRCPNSPVAGCKGSPPRVSAPRQDAARRPNFRTCWARARCQGELAPHHRTYRPRKLVLVSFCGGPGHATKRRHWLCQIKQAWPLRANALARLLPRWTLYWQGRRVYLPRQAGNARTNGERHDACDPPSFSPS